MLPPRTLESESGGNSATERASKVDDAPKLDDPQRRAPRLELTPRRGAGLFGRLFPPLAAARLGTSLEDSVTIEPKADPAADAALKRRVEKQIRESIGTRVDSYEVRVVGREVMIHAHVLRFWQRRNVRHTLETLPALSGVKAHVVVTE
jgi:hypothetical protein